LAYYFSLIMPTVGRTSEPQRFLASLRAQSYRGFELIVVDQNPDDRLEKLLASYADEFPVLHLRTTGRGASRARNTGMEYAGGCVVAFPDDDCWYPPDLLGHAARFFADHPELDGLTGRSVDESGRTSMNRFDARPGPVNRSNVLIRAIEYTVFLRRESTMAVPFDEGLGAGAGTAWGAGEATDYLLRLLDRGVSLHYDPQLVVFHRQVVPPYNGEAARKAYAYGRGMGHVLRRHRMPLWIQAVYPVRALGRAALSLAELEFAKAAYHWSTFVGRSRGLLS
jgi:glycosyltransferase involved in cell wall biosynthesis